MLYGYGDHGEAYCRCKCDCGREVVKKSYSIRHSKNPAHCGCMKKYYRIIQSESARIDLTGQRFGSLVVIEMLYEHNNKTRVKCRCDCGNIIERISTYLTSGNTTSCGCVQRRRASESNTKDFTGIKSLYGIIFLSRNMQNEKGQWLWNCKCKCGNLFVALPAKVLNGHITSCGCAKRSSRERLISTTLEELGVGYLTEYKFKDCKVKRALRFDFYIPEFNTVIEYQGEQHYIDIKKFNHRDSLKDRQMRDKIKREYCKSKNIELLELPYTLSDQEIINILQTLFIRRDCNGLYGNL